MNITKKITYCAMIAALYTALSMVFLVTSFNVTQIRVAEALTLLPVFSPFAVIGVTLGCAITNSLGFVLGANIIGPLDIFFGSAATLIAACMTYRLRDITFKGIPYLAPLPPILVNALIIGAELTYATSGSFSFGVFLSCSISVGVGQIVPCYVLGLVMVYAIKRTKLSEKMYLGL